MLLHWRQTPKGEIMRRTFTNFVVLFIVFGLSAGFVFAQDGEPNDTFLTATALMDNTSPWAEMSSSEDVDIYKLEMSTENIYHIYSDSSDLPASLTVEMFFAGDTTENILNGSPNGRAGWGDFRIAGWAPFEFGSGTYYIKLTHPEPIAGEFTGAYKIRLISQNMVEWANLHEPDNTFQDSFGQFALPIDGSRFNGMLFDINAVPTGQDDIDIFYMAGEEGKRLWVETEPEQGYPHTRDMDSKIYVWDGDGNQLLVDNDDKSNQEEDFGSNNVFSLCVIDSLPYTGLYYVIVTSYYAAYNSSDGVSSHSDSDPSTGGYVAFSWMGETKVEIEPNNAPEQATALCEAVSGTQVGGDNNLVIDAKFDSDGDVDCYAVNLKSTKMYSFNTANSMVGEDIKVEVYAKDDLSTNLIDDSVEGKYNDKDFRLSGWTPPSNGVYVVKLTPSAGSIGGENTGEYQFRLGWATWRNAAAAGEEENNEQFAGETNMVEIDSSNNVAAIYPAGDADWFWFDGNAGDVIHVEAFSGLDFDGTWGRDFDTKMTLVDPSGNVVENDDFRPDDDSRHPGNTFSAIKDYSLQGTGTVWVKVEGYYEADGDDGKNAVGTYRLFVFSSAAAPEFAEKESNDLFKTAMKLPEDKDVKGKFSKGGAVSADDVDIFALDMVKNRMYFVNTYENDLGGDIHAELFAASDTTTNVLNESIDGRYNDNNFRLSGFIPAEDGVYYLKLTCETPGQGSYTLRSRSSSIDELGPFHEPDNTIAQADAQGDFPVDGVHRTGALYNEADETKANDLDIFRFSCVQGQMLVADVMPVGGETWYRDTDTKMTLVNAAGDTVGSNDDDFGTFSKIAFEIPEDGVYYLMLYGYYSAANGKESSDRSPGVGDYVLTVSGTMSEVEPNNVPTEANMIPIANSNLIEATFGEDDLEDWYKVSLVAGNLYYFSSTESRVGEDVQFDVYSVDDPTTNLIDNSGWGRFGSSDFRLSAWTPPATGDYLLKLSIPIGAIDAQNSGSYKLRAAGGEVLAEVAAIHEPDNTLAEADALGGLNIDGTQLLSAFGDDADHDLFAFEGTQGQTATVTLSPDHGPRWIRELDTYMTLLTADSTILGSNDDYDDWYELSYYMGEVSCTYSQVVVDSLPYTGTYYVHALPYYGLARDSEPSIGNNAMGSYYVSAQVQVPVGVEEKEEEIMPSEFALLQNYPNPFNPSTTIQYQLKEPVDVMITIYNIMGQKVATLVDETQAAGSYSLLWNAMDDYSNRVSTGIYFYQINAGDTFLETKKMMLLK
jgi:hypothetical protein